MALPLLGLASAAIGIGMQFFGGNEEAEAAKKQAQIAKRTAVKQNKIIDKIKVNLTKQGDLEQKASAESAASEALRKQQMELDASRAQREVVRNSIIARANTVSNAANQGASMGSGVFGALTQITSQANRQLGGIFQNLSIGRGIFEHNASMATFLTQESRLKTKENLLRADMESNANTSGAAIQAAGVNNGSTWSNIGSTLVSSASTINSLGTTALFGKTA